jgi:catechol-2,3-dioxygenase
MLKMNFVLAIAEDEVPSTKEPDPYMHVFLDAGCGNVLAFFELPTRPPMGRDSNTPSWVQHIALKVKDRETLLRFKDHLERNGVDVLGVTFHGIFHSIYLFDPNGHRIELACPDPDEQAQLKRLDAVKWKMLKEWSVTRRAPKHAAFLHANEFAS